MIKNQTKNRNILLQTDIEYLVKPTANILLTSKILNTFPLILRAMLSDLCSYLYSKCKGYKHCNKARKRNKSHKDWKPTSKTVLLTDDMIIYVNNPNQSIKKLLKRTS